MHIKSGSKRDAVEALINLWLKDPRKTCGYCNREKDFHLCGECDGKPLLVNNAEYLKGFTVELRKLRETRSNKHAATKNKSMRFALSIPPGLYFFLKSSMKRLYNEDFDLRNKKESDWFLKNFGKYFAVPEEV